MILWAPERLRLRTDTNLHILKSCILSINMNLGKRITVRKREPILKIIQALVGQLSCSVAAPKGVQVQSQGTYLGC